MGRLAGMLWLAGVVGIVGMAGCGAEQAGGQAGGQAAGKSEADQREERYLRAAKELTAAEEEMEILESESEANRVLIDSLRRQLASQADEKLTAELNDCTRKTSDLRLKIRAQESTIRDLKTKRDAIAAGS